MTELLALAGVDSLILVGQIDKPRLSSVAVRPVRAPRRQTVSSSACWKLAFYGLHRQFCLSSLSLLQML